MKKYPQLDEVFGHELTAAQKTDKLSAVEQLIMDIPNIIHYHSNCHNTLTKLVIIDITPGAWYYRIDHKCTLP